MKRKTKKQTDLQLKEFEEKDLGDDLRKSGTGILVKMKSLPTSIFLNPSLVHQLREKAAKRGIGYQTMLKIIVTENLRRY